MALGAAGDARHALEQRAALAAGPGGTRLIGAGPLIGFLGRRRDRIGLHRRRQDIVFLELQLVFLESSGGWVPSVLERMDEQVQAFPLEKRWLSLLPSEYRSPVTVACGRLALAKSP